MNRKFNIIKITALVFIILAICVAAYLGWGLYSYMAATPEITPYENIKITSGQVVTVDELALVERSGGTFISAVGWESGSRLGITLAEDGSSFTVTEGQGVLEVIVYAQKNGDGEDRDKTVRVICE